MLTPTIIVSEQGELWLAALRTCLRRSAAPQGEPVWLHVPLRDQVAPAVARVDCPFVVVEVTSTTAASDVLQLYRWHETFPRACFVAALHRNHQRERLDDLVWVLREAGAAHVLRSPGRAAEALPILERHRKWAETTGDDSEGTWSGAGTNLLELPPCWTSGNRELMQKGEPVVPRTP